MTRNRDLVLSYLQYFCDGDLEGLSELLAPDLRFEGPLMQCATREAYLLSLESDPPEKCDFRIRSLTENENSVAVFYDYIKQNESLAIAQLFIIDKKKIKETLVIFDGRGFD